MPPNAPKSLDAKLARLVQDPNCGDFILADAKDADMAFGLAAPGQDPDMQGTTRYRSLDQYRQLIRENVRTGLVDIMLMSVSTSCLLTIEEGLFHNSPITPAVRANDATDVWAVSENAYIQRPSRPFRTAAIDHAMAGRLDPAPDDRRRGADLGLYSVTFNNDLERDIASLEAYAAFREEAERKGFRHFLEVFAPNACGDACPNDLGCYINDCVVRTLAGVPGPARPLFLKVPYLGPGPTEALAGFDRSLIVGILGGSSGTTFDAFHQLVEARRHGARVALYGRMINHSEHQPTFIQHLRWLADGDLTDPAEAVRSYHAALEQLGVTPYRPLGDDLQPSSRSLAYQRGPTRRPAAAPDADEAPDFAAMTNEEKVAWNRARWNRVFP